MEQREVFVTLISAQDLKKVNTFGKMTVYCVAWIHPDRKVSSPMDSKGNQNPTWNAILKLMADERSIESGNAVLVVDLYDHGTFGNTNVGSCTIPLSGLKPYASSEEKASKIEESTEASSSSSANFMAVEVKRPSGKSKGTLNLSVKLGELVKNASRGAPAYMAAGTETKGYPASGYPPAGYPPSGGYPPASGGYPPASGGYPPAGYPQPGYAPQPGYPPQAAYAQAQPAYPPQPGYAPQPDYPPQPGYAAPPMGAQPYPMPYQQAPYPGGMPAPYYAPAGYAAAPPPQQQQNRRSGLGGGLGAGLVGGALGGLLLGSVIGDIGDGGGGCGGDGGGCGGGCGG